MVLEGFMEILHKPSSQEVRADLDKWSGTLVEITTGENRLQFESAETELYKRWCEWYLGQKIAGGLSPKHRDRATLDLISTQIKQEINEKVEELGWKDDPTRRSRITFIQRAANLVTATYMKMRDDPQLFQRIQETVKTLIG